MNKELPSIFKNPYNKKIDNNKKVCYVKDELDIGDVTSNNIELNDAKTYEEALDNLFKNNQFVFNVPVEIVTKDYVYDTKIVSKVGERLLTSNGKVILLKDVLTIKIKS